MTKNHLKSLSAPASWNIERKGLVFITRPNPGAHSLETGLPLSVIFKTYLKYAKTQREVRGILHSKQILVDGVRRKDPRFIVGLMDILDIRDAGEAYRVLIDKRGKLCLASVKKGGADTKICKIRNKSMCKGKIQLHLHDGRNLYTDNNSYRAGDSLVLKIPEQDIKEHLPLAKGMFVYLVGGNHIGEVAEVVDIVGTRIHLKIGDTAFETLRKYAYAVGKDKTVLSIE
ncbi:30S ribosomal protein S4e [Candidatus Woesearchaeota archaeon]|nr:30S ribosomal protein S4e [Candidatus Woesearchaeota archaeon]